MRTYYVKQAAGRWLVTSQTGEAILSADDTSTATALAESLAKSGNCEVIFVDADGIEIVYQATRDTTREIDPPQIVGHGSRLQ